VSSIVRVRGVAGMAAVSPEVIVPGDKQSLRQFIKIYLN